MTIDEEYDALNVSRLQLREVARLMASGQSSAEIAVHVNMRPIDIDRIPMKYPHEWHEEMSAAARFVCHMTVLKVMAHAQMIAAETKEPKGLAALMQAIARFLRLPFLFPNAPTKNATPKGAAHAVSGAATPTTNSAPTVAAPPLTTCAAPNTKTPLTTCAAPLGAAPSNTADELSDAEIARCAEFYEADPTHYIATLEQQEPELYAKCVQHDLIPAPSTKATPRPTLTHHGTTLIQAAFFWCVTWFGLGTHPPHH